MTEAGAFTEGRSGSGFLAISDPEGDYSSAIEPVIGGDAQGAAAAALIEALRRAGRPGEEPDLVWLTATPDQEEQVIDRAAMSCSTPPTTRWGAAGMPLPALTTSYSRTPTPSRRQARCRCFPTSEKAM